MSAKAIVLTAIFCFLTPGAAFARDEVISAQLAQPATQTQLVASSALWTCAEQTCVARTSQSATVRVCRQFVREIGAPVTAFGAESAPLNSEQLAQCNDGFAAPGQQAQN
jgi:hypothetical protein